MIGLAELLDKHGGEVYADLLRHYRVDVRDVFRGRLSPRLCLELVRHLPASSATVAAIRGGTEYLGWDINTYQFADLYDVLATLTHAFIKANTDKPRSIEEPQPYPRPGVKTTQTTKSPLLARLRGEDSDQPAAGSGGRIVPLPPS